MAQINFTLSEEEILQVLTGDRDEGMRFLLEKIVNIIMKAESEEQLGASKYERSGERQDYRNGTRERELTTRIGTLTLQVPRHRNEPFHTMIFENYKRSEASLIATMVQMVIAGVSTRRVAKVVETLCGKEFSKSTVSELCKSLDKEILAFQNRRLDDIEAPFLMTDATYFKVREDHHVRSKAFMVAIAIKSNGIREIVGFGVYDAEDNYSWRHFFDSLKDRGLKAPDMVISDAHNSIRQALAKVYPSAAWQRCQVHLERNILDVVPPKYKEAVKTELNNMFNADELVDARKHKNALVEEYYDVAEKAMEILENGFEDAMTVMCLPKSMRISLRTTNILERLNREFKRRSDVIGIFPDVNSVNRLMGALAIEYSDDQSAKQCLFSEKRYNGLKPDLLPQLREIAKQQLTLLEAA